MKNIINAFVKSLAGSGSNSQICIGNGNIQCRGSISGGKVIIDGEEINLKDGTWINDELVAGDIKIEITGDVQEVNIPMGDVTVKGNVTGKVKTGQGNITIEGDVDGDVSNSMGNITINKGHKNGKVHTSMGNVTINS